MAMSWSFSMCTPVGRTTRPYRWRFVAGDIKNALPFTTGMIFFLYIYAGTYFLSSMSLSTYLVLFFAIEVLIFLFRWESVVICFSAFTSTVPVKTKNRLCAVWYFSRSFVSCLRKSNRAVQSAFCGDFFFSFSKSIQSMPSSYACTLLLLAEVGQLQADRMFCSYLHFAE